MSLGLWSRITFWWFALLLRLAYLTRARQAWNGICQYIYDRNGEKSELPTFTDPSQIWEYMKYKFQYRQDPKSGMMDYFSDPEKFHYRLLNEDIPDGDCDDVARFAAACLLMIKGVKQAYVLHTGYNGGAHATVIFQKNDNWFHFDYGVEPIRTPMEAMKNVMNRYTYPDRPKELIFWCIESLDMYPVAIHPTKL